MQFDISWRHHCNGHGVDATEECAYRDSSGPENFADQVPVTDIYDSQLVSIKTCQLPTLQIFRSSRDQYCSECFLRLWRQQLLYPMLSPGVSTDYLVDQFGKLQRECSTTMPFTTSSATLVISSTIPTPSVNSKRFPRRAVGAENLGPYYTAGMVSSFKWS